MKHILTVNSATLKRSASRGGCGECQTSCQSACKTSCTVANQSCENLRPTRTDKAPREAAV
jgi:predicted ribosomally synthesized six-cysteine peptide SCIFF